jgi:hypothetical protein
MSIEKPPKKVPKVGPRAVDSSAVKPTRALSAYIFYSLERTAQLKTLGKTQVEAMKIAGADWQGLSEEAKAPFIKKHEEDQKR